MAKRIAPSLSLIGSGSSFFVPPSKSAFRLGTQCRPTCRSTCRTTCARYVVQHFRPTLRAWYPIHTRPTRRDKTVASRWIGMCELAVALNVFRLQIFRRLLSWVVENSVHTADADATWQNSFIGSGLTVWFQIFIIRLTLTYAVNFCFINLAFFIHMLNCAVGILFTFTFGDCLRNLIGILLYR